MPTFAFFLGYLLLLLPCLIIRVNADPPAYTEKDIEQYDKGDHGIYPEIKYKSSPLVSPHTLWRKWSPKCDTPQYNYFICPRGLFVGHGGPMILDSNGQMVWHNEDFPIAYGLTVQRYKGEDYLTFWSGNDQVIGHGSGYYYMFDKHYNQFKMISAKGHLTGDLHEFKITHQNTALLTSYLNIPWDLSAFGKNAKSWIWDCYFQEIDLETNELLFEWRATDHFTFEDCFNPVRGMGGLTNPWDWFHINGVEKDSKGNYLISSRYTHALSYISGKTGDVLWHLGGKNNTFKDLSDGKATNFAWQHDVRWIKELKTLTLFDNAAYFDNLTSPARGLVLELNLDKMEVKLVSELIHPERYISESQGSMQHLENKNLFLGYGSASAMTEFDPDGQVVCDMQYGALHYHKDHSFSPSAVMSYRAYKHKWVGFPAQEPKVHFEDERVFISWNGATELRRWRFEGTNSLGSSEQDWSPVITFDRTGFESNTTLNEKDWNVWRVTALDGNANKLGIWIVYSGGDVVPLPLMPKERSSFVFYFSAGSLFTLVFLSLFRRRGEIAHLIRVPASARGYLPLYGNSNGSTHVGMNFKGSATELEKQMANTSIKAY